MGTVSTKRGYVIWAKKKGMNQHQIQMLIKEYEKETGKSLRSNHVYYPNQTERIAKSTVRFLAFTQWYSKRPKE